MKFCPHIRCKWKMCKKAGCKFPKSIYSFKILIDCTHWWFGWPFGHLGMRALDFSWKLYYIITQYWEKKHLVFFQWILVNIYALWINQSVGFPLHEPNWADIVGKWLVSVNFDQSWPPSQWWGILQQHKLKMWGSLHPAPCRVGGMQINIWGKLRGLPCWLSVRQARPGCANGQQVGKAVQINVVKGGCLIFLTFQSWV